MGQGKQSGRQKMINLMYLVFIAMIAMQMSKEVLSAFGFMNEKLTENNSTISQRNQEILDNLKMKSQEQEIKYGKLYETAESVNILSNKFINYTEALKTEFKSYTSDAKAYETMDKADDVDKYFFAGDGFTENGVEFIKQIEDYKNGVIKLVGNNTDQAKIIRERFDTSDQGGKEGEGKEPWLSKRYEGFPLIATITNLTGIQTDVEVTKSEIFNNLYSGQMQSDVSMTKYEAIIIPEKTAYFQNENFKGKIVLGKVDPSLKPEKVVLNGKEIPSSNIKSGQVLLDFPTGRIGENKLEGEFLFLENGSMISIPIKSSYSVIPTPNDAVISADKMNVVYRGVSNPLTISIPGVPDNKISATGTGLRKISGAGKYMMNPGRGKEATITVRGELQNGKVISKSQKFRIKNIPTPRGSVRKEFGYVKMPKSNLMISSVSCILPDFDFDLKLSTTGFKVKVPGQATVVVSGNRMNEQAKRAISSATAGDVIVIFDISSELTSRSSYKIKNASAVSVEIQ
jgi:gliding motility-associated protein GldM